MPRRTAASTCASASSAQYAGPTPEQRRRTRISRSGTSTTVADAAEQLLDLPAQRLVGRRVRLGEGEHAAADLDRRVRLDAERPARPGRRRARSACVVRGEQRDDRASRAARSRSRHGGELGGLVGEDDEVGALGELAVGRDRLAAELGGQRRRAAGAGVGAQHRLAPAARERARHVPGADEADLHAALTVRAPLRTG